MGALAGRLASLDATSRCCISRHCSATMRALALAVLRIIGINILLSGDNAIVIALACRALPPRQRVIGHHPRRRRRGRAAHLLHRLVQYAPRAALAEAGRRPAAALDRHQAADRRRRPTRTASTAATIVWEAVKIVAIADIVMSLDNVLAIAGGRRVADTHGSSSSACVISIPLVVAGATLIMALLTRFPILVWAGAALLGWIAGELMVERPGQQALLSMQLAPAYGSSRSSTAHRHACRHAWCSCSVVVAGVLIVLMAWRGCCRRAAARESARGLPNRSILAEVMRAAPVIAGACIARALRVLSSRARPRAGPWAAARGTISRT